MSLYEFLNFDNLNNYLNQSNFQKRSVLTGLTEFLFSLVICLHTGCWHSNGHYRATLIGNLFP